MQALTAAAQIGGRSAFDDRLIDGAGRQDQDPRLPARWRREAGRAALLPWRRLRGRRPRQRARAVPRSRGRRRLRRRVGRLPPGAGVSFSRPRTRTDGALFLAAGECRRARRRPRRIGIGGASARATLAAGLALRARDERTPALRFALLTQPALDHTCSARSPRARSRTRRS